AEAKEVIQHRNVTVLCVLVLLAIAAPLAAAEKTLVIATEDTYVGVMFVDDHILVTSFKRLPDGPQLIAQHDPTASIPLINSVMVDGRRVAVHWTFESGELSRVEPREFVATFRADHAPLQLKSIWRAHKGGGPIEHRIQITSSDDSEILLPL